MVPYQVDVAGVTVCNTVGELFTPELQREVTDLVITIERNEAAFTDGEIPTFIDTICAEIYRSFPIGQCRLTGMAGRLVNAGSPYYRVRYEITVRAPFPGDADAWKRRILNQGHQYIDDTANFVPTPDGALMLLTSLSTKADPSSPYVLHFAEYAGASWTGLGLP
jgi:hypothetical protein